MSGHRTTGDVHVRAPARLVREDHPHLFSDGAFFRVGRTHHAGQVVGVGHGDAALARGHAFDLVGVAAFGRARHVGHQSFEPVLGFGGAQMFDHRAEQAQVVGVRARTDAQTALVDRIGQFFVGVHVLALDFELVVDDHAGAGRKAEPVVATVVGGLGAQLGRNGRIEHLGLDGLEQAVDFALPQACGIHQQDHVGGRGRAFCLQAGQNSGIIGVHPVDLDAGGFGEVGVQRFVGAVVPGRIQVQNLLLGHRTRREQQGGGGSESELFQHAGDPSRQNK